MEMINRLNGDALDSQKFVDKLMLVARQDALIATQNGPYQGENRQQRRARERAERNAAARAAKALP